MVSVGAMLNAHPAEGETPSFKGSMMMVVAENEEKVLELLSQDIYTKSDVWDLANAQIIPVSRTLDFLVICFVCLLLLVQVCCSGEIGGLACVG